MYKYILVVSFLVTCCCYVQAMDEQTISKMRKCQQKLNVDESAVQDLITWNKLATDENFKCFTACLLTELKLLKNGIPDLSVAETWNKMNFISKDMQQFGQAGSSYCVHQYTSNDECQKAYEMLTCYFNFVKHYNLHQNEVFKHVVKNGKLEEL